MESGAGVKTRAGASLLFKNLNSLTSNHVTVAMPVFNGSADIARAITSVKNQTFQQWRLLIVDNASTDQTLEVVQQVGTDPRIQVVASSDHVSALANFRRALKMCESKYVCFLAHDDHWNGEFLAELVSGLEQSSAIQGACPRVVLFTESDEITVRIQTRRWMGHTLVDRRGLISIHSKQVNAWYGLYRFEYLKRVWESIDPVVSEYNPASDRAYVAALLSQPVIYCEEALLLKAALTQGTRLTSQQHRESNRQVYSALRLHNRASCIKRVFLRAELLRNQAFAALRGWGLAVRQTVRRIRSR